MTKLTADLIISTAKKYIGVKEYPANSNDVQFNTDYYGYHVHDGLNGLQFPWCCTFVWDIFRIAGASKLFYDGKKTASCISVMSWGDKNKLTVNTKDGIKGDLLLFDWNKNKSPDHIGFVLSNDGNGYTTIEGNTSVGNDSNGGEVMIRKRLYSSVCRVIRPMYDKEEKDMTQEQFNKMLAVALGIKGTGDEPSAWAAEACEKAKENGLFAGSGEGDFGWQQPVTREQLAVILAKE